MSSDQVFAGMIGETEDRITAVNGESESVNQQVRLSSGALVHIHSDGTWIYDRAGAFSDLRPGQCAIDSVSYDLRRQGGQIVHGTLAVTVHSTLPRPVERLPMLPDNASGGTPQRLQAYGFTGRPLSIDVPAALGDQFDRNGLVVLTERTMCGTASVDQGTVRFQSLPDYAGTTVLHCLVESKSGVAAPVDIELHIEPPIEFHSSVGASGTSRETQEDPIAEQDLVVGITRLIVPLSSNPRFRGHARPGWQVEGLAMVPAGDLVTRSFAVADVSGTWSLTLQGLQRQQKYRVQFRNASGAHDRYGYLDLLPPSGKDYLEVPETETSPE